MVYLAERSSNTLFSYIVDLYLNVMIGVWKRLPFTPPAKVSEFLKLVWFEKFWLVHKNYSFPLLFTDHGEAELLKQSMSKRIRRKIKQDFNPCLGSIHEEADNSTHSTIFLIMLLKVPKPNAFWWWVSFYIHQQNLKRYDYVRKCILVRYCFQ